MQNFGGDQDVPEDDVLAEQMSARTDNMLVRNSCIEDQMFERNSSIKGSNMVCSE